MERSREIESGVIDTVNRDGKYGVRYGGGGKRATVAAGSIVFNKVGAIGSVTADARRVCRAADASRKRVGACQQGEHTLFDCAQAMIDAREDRPVTGKRDDEAAVGKRMKLSRVVAAAPAHGSPDADAAPRDARTAPTAGTAATSTTRSGRA